MAQSRDTLDSQDLAPLSRLTRLEVLRLPWEISLPEPLPQLPALTTFRGNTSNLQLLSPVVATLENLELSGNRLDFKQPTRLADFTRLRKLHCCFESYTFLDPDEPRMLPPTLLSISMAWTDDDYLDLDQVDCFFQVGGQMVIDQTDKLRCITWNRHASV